MKNTPITFILILLVSLLASSKTNAQNKPKSKAKPMTDFRSQMPKPGPAPVIQISDYTEHILKNGLKVIVVENHKLPRLSFQLFIDNDNFLEKDSKGYVALAGNLIGKGTTKRTKAQIDEDVDFLGASFSANSNGFYASSLTKHTDKLLEIVSDCVLNPTFPQAEFEKVKNQTLSGLQQEKDDPNTIARNVASVLNFGGDYPYGENTTEKSLKNITLQQCIDYYQTYFKPNNAYFIVVGDIKSQEAIYYAEKYFGGWAAGNVPKHSFATPKPNVQPTVNFVNKDGAVQSVVNITYPVELKPGSEDAIKVSVMNNILGGSAFTARLFQNLREKHAYTYGAYSSLGPDKLISNFSATASVRNEVTDSAVTQFLFEMNRIKSEKVTENELTTIKNMLAGNFSRSLESPQTVANFALSTIRFNLPKDYYKNYLARLDAINADDVLKTAQKYILPEKANIIVVGNKDEVAEKLKRFSNDKKVNFYNAFGEKIIESAPVDLSKLSPENILNDYLSAIGGNQQISQIKDIHIVSETTFQGMALHTDKYVKSPDKFAEKMTMNGMVMQEQVINGTKGIQGQMGQREPMDAETFKATQEELNVISQQKYLADKYNLKLIGTESIDGKDAYKIEVTLPSGVKKIEYYDVTSKLKLREVNSQSAGEKTITMTTDYSDYRAVNGVMLPYKSTITGGMMPMPIEMIVKTIDINKGVEDSIFKID
ncbi:MAG: insulinase family protein [Saprospiraceae bacterium]|jgi:zinc protease|nr:insulinase family protein [Saprospiraceae bacterium]